MIAPAGARIRGRSRPFRPMHGNRCYVKLTNESQSRRDPLPGRLAHLAGPSLTSSCRPYFSTQFSSDPAASLWKILKTEFFANCDLGVRTGLERTP